MRVLYVLTTAEFGGGNKVLLDLEEGLDRSRFQPLNAIPESGPIEQELNRLGLPSLIVDVRPRHGRVTAALKITQLALICLRRRIGIMHINDPFTYRLAGMSAALARSLRVCHIHHPNLNREVLGWAFRRPPHVVIVPSRFMKRYVEERLDASQKVRVEVAWNPIDTNWFRPAEDVPGLRSRLGLEPNGLHVSILAEVAPHKGHICFLRAARLILDRFPGTSFHIVGRTKDCNKAYEEDLHRLVGELGLAERVRFWGFVPGETARDLLASSDLFVLPTREEGFTLSVAEAQACQVPVLSSAMPPLDEVVDDGRTGYLLDPQEPAGFAARAIELLGSSEARARMGRAGREWVAGRFSRPAHISRIMALYEELSVASRGRRIPQASATGG
jgi:glycosyltransferase involved in cell wall biosynthesis